MIAVAHDEAGKIAVFDGARVFRCLIRIGIAQMTVFGNDQKTHAVTRIQQEGGDGIVRGTDGVAAHFLQSFEPPFKKPVRHRHPDPGVVLVHIDALEFDVPAIQKEAVVGVETNLPHPESRRQLIDHLAGHRNGAAQLIKAGVLQRPKAGLGQWDLLRCL